MGENSFLWLIPAIFTAFLISYLTMPVIIKIAGLKRLMDEPDNNRKLHHSVTPTLGGIGIFAAFLISFSIWGNAGQLGSYPFLVASLFMLLLVGITDDILILSPIKKLFIQLLAASELVIAGNVVITDFGGVFGIYEVPFWVGAVLTIVVITAFVNSFNLIDGIDGLAGGIGIIISAIFGIWFYGAGFYTLAVLSFVLSGALVGFLIYNMHPAKIFMGDTGAMSIGFILAFIVIEFVQLNQTVSGTPWFIENAIVFAFAIMIIPAVDTMRVIFLRVSNGLNPFKAARNHTHHKLIDIGITPHFASFSLWISNIIIIAMVYSICDILDPTLLFLFVTSLGFMILPIIKWIYQNFYGIRLKSDGTFTFYSLLSGKNRKGYRDQNSDIDYSGYENKLKSDGKGVG